MKKEIIKRLIAFMCVAAFVFCDVGTVLAETDQEEAVTQEVPEHQHTYVESITKQPSTTQKGEKTFACECGDSYTEEIPMKKMPAPKNFTVKNYGYTQLQLTWSKVSNAEGYEIYRATTKTGTYKKVTTVGNNASKYTDKKLTTNKTYYYKIRAYYGEQPGNFTTIKSGIPKVLKPTMKKTANATGSSIKVSWTKPAGATGYYVYRKQGTGSWSKIATIKNSATLSYTDKKATAKYSYSVIAFKTVNGKTYTSDRSNVIVASVLKKATVTVKQKGTKAAVTVKWNKISNATGYEVYRKIDNSKWKLLYFTDSNTFSYSESITGLGKTYYYRVRAIRKINDTMTYALYSTAKNICFDIPEISVVSASSYGSSVKTVKLKIKNIGSQSLRVYSDKGVLVDPNNDANSREIYLVNSSGKKINYSDVNAGSTKTLTFKVDGAGISFRKKSMIGIIFRYDGLEYYVITYADGSYGEIYLAEDFFA